MNARTQSTLLIALACTAPVLFAQETSKPPAELDQLSVFVGSWQCSGQLLAQGSSPGHATTAVGHGVKALDGRWMQFAYEENKTSVNPTPYHISGYMGYDGGKRQFVQTIVDNFGNYTESFSEGWKGDTLTFDATETTNGKSRDNFVRKGQDAFMHFGEASHDAGATWVKMDEETCRIRK